MGSTSMAAPPSQPVQRTESGGMVVHSVERKSRRGGSKRDGDAFRFQAEEIRAGGKWKEFHRNGGSPIWYHQILVSGVSEGMIQKLC